MANAKRKRHIACKFSYLLINYIYSKIRINLFYMEGEKKHSLKIFKKKKKSFGHLWSSQLILTAFNPFNRIFFLKFHFV